MALNEEPLAIACFEFMELPLWLLDLELNAT